MMRRAVLTVFVFALGIGGCETRDRDNPFDPQNPNTGGVPPAIEALAGDGSIELSWDVSGFEGIEGIALERGTAAEAPIVLEPSVDATGSRVDRAVENGTTYAYRLVVSTGAGDRLESTSELATPGASTIWFGDAAGLGIGQMSPDGRDLTFRTGSGRAFLDMTVDLGGGVWAADFFNGEVAQLDRTGELVRLIQQPGANVVVHDPASAQVWVGSYLERSLSRYSVTDGRQSLQLFDIGLTEDMAVEPFPGAGVWVGTRDNGLVRVDNNQIVRSWTEFEWPVAVSREPAGWVWVVDRALAAVSQVRVTGGEVVQSTAEFVDPRDCSLDGAGGLYVADPGRGGVVHLDAGGAEIGFWDLPAASGVTRDPLSGLLWIVFRDSGEIGVYDSEGRERARTEVFGSPVKVEGFWQ